MSRHVDHKPCWMRLTPKAWAMIRSEYLAGKTAPMLARAWGISKSAIYKHASAEGWSKREAGLAYVKVRLAAIEAKGAPASSLARVQDEAFEACVGDHGDDPGGFAANLAFAALASVGPAMQEGRAADAKAYASLCELMRKLASRERAALRAAPRTQNDAQEFVAERWRYIAEVAALMLHNPAAAPMVFAEQIAAWRRAHLGESAEEARRGAADNAAAAMRAAAAAFSAPGCESVPLLAPRAQMTEP